MAITLTDGNATGATTEYYLASASTTKVDQTTDCILQVFIDPLSMAAGDQYQFTIYEKVNASTQRIAYQSILTGAQSALWVSPSLILGDGYECSVKKLAGTDRTLPFSLRRIT